MTNTNCPMRVKIHTISRAFCVADKSESAGLVYVLQQGAIDTAYKLSLSLLEKSEDEIQ